MDRLARHLSDVRSLVTKTDSVLQAFSPKTLSSAEDRSSVKRVLADVSSSLHQVRARLDQAMNSTMTTRVNLSVGVPLDNKQHHHINPDGVSLMAVGLADRAGHDASGSIPLHHPRRRSQARHRKGGRRSRGHSRPGTTVPRTRNGASLAMVPSSPADRAGPASDSRGASTRSRGSRRRPHTSGGGHV